MNKRLAREVDHLRALDPVFDDVAALLSSHVEVAGLTRALVAALEEDPQGDAQAKLEAARRWARLLTTPLRLASVRLAVFTAEQGTTPLGASILAPSSICPESPYVCQASMVVALAPLAPENTEPSKRTAVESTRNEGLKESHEG